MTTTLNPYALQDLFDALEEMLAKDRGRYAPNPAAEKHFLRNNTKALAALAKAQSSPENSHD